MTEKHHDLIWLLGRIQVLYRSGLSVRDARITAVRERSRSRGVDRQTVADVYIRRLRPDVQSTAAFDRLLRHWLSGDRKPLEDILIRHGVPRSLLISL